MAMNDQIDFDWELERLANIDPPEMANPMDIDWSLDRPINDKSGHESAAMGSVGLLRFAALPGIEY